MCSCNGCNAWEIVDGAGVMATQLPQGEESTDLEMAAVKMCLLAVCYVSPQPPVADGLLIKQKLDTETNYCIALLCGLIQDLVLLVGPVKATDSRRAEEKGTKKRSECMKARIIYLSGSFFLSQAFLSHNVALKTEFKVLRG